MVLRQRLVVPADGPADLVRRAVDPAGRVVRRRDAAGDPVLEPAEVAEPGGDGPRRRPGLAFELHQVQLGDAALGPQVGRQPDLGDDLAVEVEGQALDGARC